MDELDKKLLMQLSTDGRLKNSDLAEKLSVSEGTVRNRLKRLSESGDFRITATVNPESVSNRQLVLLGVNIATSRELKKISEQISDLPDVDAVMITSGRYDMIIEVWLEFKTGLIRFIDEELSSVQGIVSTESFMVMKSYNKWLNIQKD
ncbi:Lrp/AsnC family transcriptional regulator [Lentisphaerota bacterium ZTH]|nr:Lrp/AsnC family transcriptional regulator [Lentisphaerota bacterium]WET05472.1 Lrp/AsnC family transcriptional regulator [Lentisphaerota bacterium ZTH]